jgi:hypothetical protein
MLHSQAQNLLNLSTSKTLTHAKNKHKPKHTTSKEWRSKHAYLFLSTTKTLTYAREKKKPKHIRSKEWRSKQTFSSKPLVSSLTSSSCTWKRPKQSRDTPLPHRVVLPLPPHFVPEDKNRSTKHTTE